MVKGELGLLGRNGKEGFTFAKTAALQPIIGVLAPPGCCHRGEVSYLQFDQGVGQVKTVIASWKLYLLNSESGKIAEANDGLGCGDKSLCEGTNHGRKNGTGKYAHVEIKSNSETPDEH